MLSLVTIVVVAGTPIDTVFKAWAVTLPEPKSLADSNGMGFSCPNHQGGTTLTNLSTIAKTVPITTDAELVQLVPWARHTDACLRHIAIEAILAHLPSYARNSLSVPPMHDPEHFQFHDIMVALTQHLDSKKIAWNPRVFEGLLVKTTLADFATLAHGKWVEEIGPQKGFQEFVTLDAKTVAVMSRHLPKDPKWPDHTWTSAVKTVTRDARGIFTLTCDWSQESNADGYQGDKQVPAQFSYSIWPVAPGIVWFREGERYWIKLKRQ